MQYAKSTSEFIRMAAELAIADVPVASVATIHSVEFMKSHPEILLAWREFGMTPEKIAEQLTRLGLPARKSSVETYLTKSKQVANRLLVDSMLAELRRAYLVQRVGLVDRANKLSIVSVSAQGFASPFIQPSPVQVSTPVRANGLGQAASIHASLARPSPVASRPAPPRAVPVAQPVAKAPEAPSAPIPSIESLFIKPRAQALVEIPGEDEDMNERLSRKFTPCSFGDFRRSLWANYSGPEKKNKAVLPCGTESSVPSKLAAPLLRGEYRNWNEYIAAVEKAF